MAHARPSIHSDVTELAPKLRSEDVRECAALGLGPVDALSDGLKGHLCLTILDDQEVVVGMFGMRHLPEFGSEQACVWLLASPGLVSIKRQFMRETAEWLQRFHDVYPLLWNWVDSRNETHVRWLRIFGFTFLRTVTVGAVPFYEFVRLP